MKTLTLAFQLLVLTLVFSCNRELASLNETPALSGGATSFTAGLQGNVIDSQNQPIVGAVVTVGSASTVTDSDGFFKFATARLNKNISCVSVSKAGYFTGVRGFAATNGTNQVVIKIFKKYLIGQYNTNSFADVVLNGGSAGNARISIQNLQTVSKTTNQPYSGLVNVYARYIDPTLPDIGTTIPGGLTAMDSSNNWVLLKSFGMLAVNLETPSGDALQLAAGTRAKLSIPIPISLQSTAPVTLPLWYMNEQTALWMQEGNAVKTGNSYEGWVSHFSFWNADIQVPSVMIEMRFLNGSNQPLASTYIDIQSMTQGSQNGFTDSLGQVRGLVPANEPLLVSARNYACNNGGSTFFSQTIGPFSAATVLPPFTVAAGVGNTTFTGNVTNCAGQPLQTGTLRVKLGIYSTFYPIVNGSYNFQMVTCGSASQIKFIAIDAANNQESAEIPQTVNSSNVTVAPIAACGVSTAEFINYSINGAATALTNTNTSHAIIGYFDTFANSVILLGTNITGASQNKITLAFATAANPLTGPNSMLGFQANAFTNTILPTPPPTVTLTAMANSVGQFYEGNFNGTFRDSTINSPTHTMNGSFRVRRSQ